jgi:hypothetical protein
MMVVVTIIGLLLAAAALSLHNVLRSDLRSGASRTAGAMRFAFDRATMTGKIIRLAFDIEKGEIWLEGSEDRMGLRRGADQRATSGDKGKGEAAPVKRKKKSPMLDFFAPPVEEGAGSEGGDDLEAPGIVAEELVQDWEADQQPVQRARARFEKLKGMMTKKIKLARGVEVDALITPRMEEPVVEGTGYVYFFPQGHAEPAIIHLVNTDEEYYSVVLHPLTGLARVYPCMYRIPEDFGVSDDKRERSSRDPCVDMGGI